MAEEQSQARDKAEEPENVEPQEENATAEGRQDVEPDIEQLRSELESAKAEQLRLLAELENVRKRARRDVEQAHKFAVEKIAEDLLNVKDSLEMGLRAAQDEKPSVEQLREGKEMTLRQLSTVMERAGVAELNPEGEVFNPEFHEAMTVQESADQAPDTITQVIQKGYLLKGRLLRPARVIVAKAPEEND